MVYTSSKLTLATIALSAVSAIAIPIEERTVHSHHSSGNIAKKVGHVLNKVGPAVLENGLPILGQLIPPPAQPQQPQQRSLEARKHKHHKHHGKGKGAASTGNGAGAATTGTDTSGSGSTTQSTSGQVGQDTSQRREFDDYEELIARKIPLSKAGHVAKKLGHGLKKIGPTVLEHGLPIAGQLIPPPSPQEPQQRDFDDYEELVARKIPLSKAGHVAKKLGHGLKKIGPTVLEHGLPIAGQLIPPPSPQEPQQRDFDEYELEARYVPRTPFVSKIPVHRGPTSPMIRRYFDEYAELEARFVPHAPFISKIPVHRVPVSPMMERFFDEDDELVTRATHSHHSAPKAGSVAKKSGGHKNAGKWAEAAVSGGLDFASNAIASQQQRRAIEARAGGKNRGKWATAAVTGGLDFASNAIAAHQGKRGYFYEELEELD